MCDTHTFAIMYPSLTRLSQLSLRATVSAPAPAPLTQEDRDMIQFFKNFEATCVYEQEEKA